MSRLRRLNALSFLFHAYYAALSLLASSSLLDHLAVRGAHKAISLDDLTASGSRLLDAIVSYLAVVCPPVFDLISQLTIWLIPMLWLACVMLTVSDVRVGMALFLRAVKHKAPVLVLGVICMLTGVLLLNLSGLFAEGFDLSLFSNAGTPNLVVLLLLPLTWRRGIR